MNKLSILLLKCLQHGYLKCFSPPKVNPLPVLSREEGNNLIYQMLCKGDPCMIARYGATELICILNYLAIKKQDRNLWRYIKGETNDWWWNPRIMAQMQRCGGFFPPTEEKLSQFSEIMLSDSQYMDVLAVISNSERKALPLQQYLKDDIKCIPLTSFDSFLSEFPWTRYLKDKKVLVVHPYANLIEKQYEKRSDLFQNQDVLPNFNLRTVEAVQSLGGVNHGHIDWFKALEWMKGEMDKEPYDVCLIGCGAYGFPLAAHSKRTGHQAIHIGGPLQLLFGIKGGRWEKPTYARNYNLPDNTYLQLMNNPSWVRPSEYKTKELEQVEKSAYL